LSCVFVGLEDFTDLSTPAAAKRSRVPRQNGVPDLKWCSLVAGRRK
jgi:hypothetical protein